jgi:D-mannonate dehydratase
MNQPEKLTLIQGNFNNEDAKDILLNIFSTKIHFHEIRNISSQERFGKNDDLAQHRIPELKECMEKVKQMVALAKSQNKNLIINSEIIISIADN